MPGAWIGALRQVSARTTEVVSTPQGELVETRAPQWLLALWPPQRLQRPFLRRWPGWVSLHAAEAETHAVLELLRHVPAGASLWVLEEELDWALMAEIVLLSEPGLQEFQQRALKAFMQAERAATTSRILSAYGQARQPQQPAQRLALPRLL